MNKRARTRLIVVTVIILGIVGGLIYYSSRGGTLAYKTPTEVQAQAATLQGKGVRVTGEVATGTIVRDTDGLKFDVTDRKSSVPVLFTGTVPDTFKEGLQVIVDGTYGADGRVTSKSMVTKCPTKFQAELGKNTTGSAASTGSAE